MDQDAISLLLEDKHTTLFNWLEQHDQELWETGPEGKWTAGQQVLHLLQSIKPLNLALSLPKLFLKYKYGVANRDVRDYDTVVNRYLERLEDYKNIVSPYSKAMKVPKQKDKQYLINRLQVESKKLQHKTKKLSNKNLDALILPHPLMGKMPIREIIMWTAYHTEHHTKQLIENY